MCILYTLHLNPIIYYYIILIVYNLRLGHTKIKPYAESTKSVILLQMPQQNNDNFNHFTLPKTS